MIQLTVVDNENVCAEIKLSVTPDGMVDGSRVVSMVPFSYAIDFEEKDPFKKWASNGSYTIKYKGITSEKKSNGGKSFLIDIKFDTATYVYFSIPVMIPSEGNLEFRGDIFIEDANNASASLGTTVSLYPCKKSGNNLVSKEGNTAGWLTQTSDIGAIAQDKATRILSKYCALAGPKDVGIWTDKIALFLFGEKGASIKVFVDNVNLEGKIPEKAEYEKVANNAWESYLDRVNSDFTSMLTKLDGNVDSEKIDSISKDVELRGYPSPDEFSEIETIVRLLPENSIDYSVIDPISKDSNVLSKSDFSQNKVVKLVAANNEFEPASFIIRNNSSKKVNIKYNGISWVGKNSIVSEAMDLRYVKRWYQAAGAWDVHWKKNDKDAKIVPELLLKDPSLVKVDQLSEKNFLKINNNGNSKYIDISERKLFENEPYSHESANFYVEDSKKLLPIEISSEGGYQQYWLTLDSNFVQPGEYEGNLVFKTNGEDLLIPLEITVLPFDLAQPPIDYTIYYRGVLHPDDIGTISSEFKNKQQLKAEMQNIKAHGINNIGVYQTLQSKKNWSDFSSSTLHETMHNYLKIMREAGFDSKELLYLGSQTGVSQSEKAIDGVLQNLEEINTPAKKYDFEQVYMYGTDEAAGEELLAQQKVWKAVRDKGGKIFVAGSSGHIPMMGELTDLLIYYNEISKNDLDYMHQKGNKVFKYQDPQSGPENPLLFRYKRGLYLWQKGFDGVMDYAYQHSFGFIWNDFDHEKYRDHVFAYPTATGVIDTIAWEGYREGIDDLRYIATLKSILSEENPEISAEASKYLDSLKNDEEIDLVSMRKKIISFIQKLSVSN